MALLAHAFLSVLATTQPDDSCTRHDELIPLTRHEIRRRFTGFCQQLTAPTKQGHWSRGYDGIRPPSEPATTADEPSRPHDHYELSLEYQ